MTIEALYPTVRPTLNLNFARTKALDPRVTFTRASTGTFVGSNGLIQTAASNAARFDHNPTTGESLGLLVEEARTNLLTYSNFNSNWGLSQATFTPNSEVAPDGTLTAGLLTGNSNLGSHHIAASAVIGASPHTFFCFIKAGSTSTASLFLTQSGNNGAVYNVSTGTVVNVQGTGNTASIQSAGNGWWKCSITNTGSSDIFNEVRIGIDDSVIVARSAPGSIYIWGAQLEAGSFPTSYIPTSGATATRAADVASMTGTNFSSWWNSTASTFLVTGKTGTNRTAPGGGYGYLGTLPITGYVYYLLYVNGPEVATFDGTNKANVNVSDQSQTHRMAVALTTTNQYVVTDGGSVATTVYNNARSASTGLTIGKSFAELNGTIARLTYYPVRLPDAQLQELTK